jgi:hypothetical protein
VGLRNERQASSEALAAFAASENYFSAAGLTGIRSKISPPDFGKRCYLKGIAGLHISAPLVRLSCSRWAVAGLY